MIALPEATIGVVIVSVAAGKVTVTVVVVAALTLTPAEPGNNNFSWTTAQTRNINQTYTAQPDKICWLGKLPNYPQTNNNDDATCNQSI